MLDFKFKAKNLQFKIASSCFQLKAASKPSVYFRVRLWLIRAIFKIHSTLSLAPIISNT